MILAKSAQTDTANADDALQSAVLRLASPFKALAAERQKLPDTAAGRLNALLREIDETILPREVSLVKDGSDIAKLSVSNRRLFKITAITASAPETNASDVDTLAAQLLEYAKDVTSIGSRAAAKGTSCSDDGSGVGITKLRAALGLDSGVNDISRLTDLLTPNALAQLTWADGLSKPLFSGSESWRDLLEAHAQRITENIATQDTKKLSAPVATTGMALPFSNDRLLVVACKDQTGVASITTQSDGLKAISTWQITNGDPS